MITADSKRRDKEQAARDKVQEEILYYVQDNNLYLSRLAEAHQWPRQVTIVRQEDVRYY